MKKNILGILGLLIVIFIVTAVLNPKFLSAYNMQNLVKWSSLYAIMGVGVAFVIITGGIDLSIGSVIGLVASLLAFTLNIKHWNPAAAIVAMLMLSVMTLMFPDVMENSHDISECRMLGMSRMVSVIMLLVYGAYLFFQL